MFHLNGDSHGNYNDDNGTNYVDTNDNDGLNRSYNSNVSSNNNASASSSKAVLAALRALQDKIRRLEAERQQALDETVQLRHQIKNQEIEAEHHKQRDNLEAQKSLHEIRTAYERILQEKTETEMRLSKLENRYREDMQIASDLRSKILTIEDEKHEKLLNIKDLEAERTQLQSQIQHIQQKEKDLGQTMLWETKRHEEDMDVLSKKLRSLQNDLTSIIHEKSIVETKLIELDQLVGQLLSVNESLVVRLSGKPLSNGIPKKTVKIVKKKKTASMQQNNLPRAASMSTVSQMAAKPSMSIKNAANDSKNLHDMHKMYVDLAHSITSNGSSSAVKKVRKTSITGENGRPTTMMRDKKMNDDNVSINVRIPSVSYDKYEHDNYDTSNIDTINSNSLLHGNYRHVENNDIKDVIISLEEEFTMLNNQYRSLLVTVQDVSASVETNQNQAQELVSVIQKLHRKGEQLRALKSPPRRERNN